MLKTDKSKCTNNFLEPKTIKLGISSIPKTGRVNQPRVNGTEIGDSRLILTSTLFPNLDQVDISTTSLAETS